MKPNQTSALVAIVCGGLYCHAALCQTWTALTNAPNQEWQGVASSADGSRLVAVTYGGGIYISTNSGATWLASDAPIKNWRAVACSADGTKLVAAGAHFSE